VIKIPKIIIISFAACLSCCDSKNTRGAPSELNPAEKSDPYPLAGTWKPLENNLADYVAENPNRPIILSINATWSGTALIGCKVLSSEAVMNSLSSSGFLCLAADVTEENALARRQMET